MWQWIEARIRVKVFFVSLFRRVFFQHPCIFLLRYHRIVVAYIFEPVGCVWHTDSLDRTNLSFSSPLCPFLPILQGLEPANDSWKNNSENERATTVEEWDPG